MLIWVIYCNILLIRIVSSEIITLIGDKKITCVMTENSSAYITSLMDDENQLTAASERTSDWMKTDSSDGCFGPITDERWNDFTTGRYDSYIIKDTLRSFSVYSNNANLNLTFYGRDNSNEKTILVESNKNITKENTSFQWFHYTIIGKHNGFILFDNSSTLIKDMAQLRFDPKFVKINNINSRLHVYNYFYSDQVSLENSSHWTVVSSKNLCLSMYVAVDKNCSLDIIFNVNGKNILNRTVEGFNEYKLLRKWEKLEIRSNSPGKGELFLIKKRLDGQKTGFWAFHIFRFCPDSIATFSINLPAISNNKYLCKNLYALNKLQNNSTFCNKTGHLGKNCDLSCEELLDKSSPNCQKHKICLENRICSCAWGYTGSSCSETCVNGYWGLNCNLACDMSRCEQCDIAYGCITCRRPFFGKECSNKLPVVLKSPVLKSLTENSVTILINLRYAVDEITPEFYQIQYKNVNETVYKNVSGLQVFPRLIVENQTCEITNLSTTTQAYNIRVILIAQNQSMLTNIPKLLTYKKSLYANFTYLDGDISLVWASIKEASYPTYKIKYTCTKIGKNVTKEITTEKTNTTIQDVAFFKNCEIELWVINFENRTILIDNIFVEPLNMLNSALRQDSMKTSSSTQHQKVTKLENIDKFYFSATEEATISIVSISADEKSGVEIKNPKESSVNSLVLILVTLILCILITLTGIFCCWKISHLKNNNLKKTEKEEKIMLMPADENENIVTIQVNVFESYLEKTLLSTNNIENQFSSIPKVTAESCAVGLEDKNIKKNKDKIYVPYDSTRVILKTLPGMGTDDYINATYIDGYDRPKAYIACQGPKFSTIKDFWRLIWQEGVENIVMATNFIENKTRMCAEYWPQKLNTIFECGEMAIKLINEEIYEFYDTRSLEIYYRQYSRRVRHIHLRWESNSEIPIYPNALVPAIKYIRQITSTSVVPMIIHSGFGINRTGTIILCDLALTMANTEDKINFYTLFKTLREQRPYIINKKESFSLAHLIVLECIMELQSPFKKCLSDNLDKNVIKEQLSYLKRLNWHDRIVKSWFYHSSTKSNLRRPSYVDGYKNLEKYLIVQQPQKQSALEFWNVVMAKDITHILFLNRLKEKHLIWPQTHHTCSRVVSVRFLHEKKCCFGTTTMLLLQKYETRSGTKLYESSVCVFEFIDWNEKHQVPNSADNFFEIIDAFNKATIRDRASCLVACNDGITACGLFVVLSYIIEKYEKELEIDVCNGIRIARRSGREFVNNAKQVAFIYSFIRNYFKIFENYDHIEE